MAETARDGGRNEEEKYECSLDRFMDARSSRAVWRRGTLALVAYAFRHSGALAVYKEGPCGFCSLREFQLRDFVQAASQSPRSDDSQTNGNGNGETRQTTRSPRRSSVLCFPSPAAHAVALDSIGTSTESVTWSGKIIGRKERVCGQMGVKSMAGTDG